MELLRLLFALIFAVVSVGVLVLPMKWQSIIPSFKTETSSAATLPVVLDQEAPTEVVLSLTPLSELNDISNALSIAKALATDKQYDAALRVLANLQAQDQSRYEVVYLRARILSWSGKHLAAEQKFFKLMTEYPDNLDVKVSYGYLQYYQGRMSEAEKTFQDVLHVSPDYADAQNGLTNARRAM